MGLSRGKPAHTLAALGPGFQDIVARGGMGSPVSLKFLFPPNPAPCITAAQRGGVGAQAPGGPRPAHPLLPPSPFVEFCAITVAVHKVFNHTFRTAASFSMFEA